MSRQLSETKEDLIEALMICGCEYNLIIGSMLMMDTEEKADCLLNWILDNPNCSVSGIMIQATLIHQTGAPDDYFTDASYATEGNWSPTV